VQEILPVRPKEPRNRPLDLTDGTSRADPHSLRCPYRHFACLIEYHVNSFAKTNEIEIETKIEE